MGVIIVFAKDEKTAEKAKDSGKDKQVVEHENKDFAKEFKEALMNVNDGGLIIKGEAVRHGNEEVITYTSAVFAEQGGKLVVSKAYKIEFIPEYRPNPQDAEAQEKSKKLAKISRLLLSRNDIYEQMVEAHKIKQIKQERHSIARKDKKVDVSKAKNETKIGALKRELNAQDYAQMSKEVLEHEMIQIALALEAKENQAKMNESKKAKPEAKIEEAKDLDSEILQEEKHYRRLKAQSRALAQ